MCDDRIGIVYMVRHNVMKVTSINSFIQIKGGMNNGCKDVLFVRGLGVDKDTVKNIDMLDNVLGLESSGGKLFYNRVTTLPKMQLPEDISYYTGKYDEWLVGGKQKLAVKSEACKNALFQSVLSEACKTVEALYGKYEGNATDSMKKNFVVKCMFWYDAVFAKNTAPWNEKANTKIVVTNVLKKQEYLFWYMVSLCGNDVLMLQLSDDIKLEHELDGLSDVFNIGGFNEVTVLPYVQTDRAAVAKPVEEQRGNGVATTEERRTNIRMVIPERPRSSNSRAQGNTVPQSSNARIQSPRTSARVEKSYEELAQMASSVVLIAIHDRTGNVIGTGSGIMIGRNGYILTNNHVASGGRFYTVKIEDDDRVYKTDEVIKYNQVLDLAVIRIDRQLEPLPIYKGAAKLVRGQKVVAIGSPLGLFNSVSDGIISGFRKIENVDMIQFTAPISHGSSGGAVLNMYGEVIGISTAGIDSGQNINLAMGYECINTFIRGFTN